MFKKYEVSENRLNDEYTHKGDYCRNSYGTISCNNFSHWVYNEAGKKKERERWLNYTSE